MVFFSLVSVYMLAPLLIRSLTISRCLPKITRLGSIYDPQIFFRDHLADSLTTLPDLISKGKDASLHFYFANLTNMHKHLFPALIQAYESWVTQGKLEAIEELVPASKTHWNELANQMLETYRKNPNNFANQLQTLIEIHKF